MSIISRSRDLLATSKNFPLTGQGSKWSALRRRNRNRLQPRLRLDWLEDRVLLAVATGNIAKNYQHWADGDAPLTPGEAEWNGDILSDGKSDYFEGEVIPHVYVVQSSNSTPLVNGQSYSFDIIYNFYNTSGNASGFDYVTTYDISRDPDLLPNASGTVPVIDSSFTDLGDGNRGVFYTVDANITSVTVPPSGPSKPLIVLDSPV